MSRLLVLLASGLLSSCVSCYYGPVAPDDTHPAGLPLGTKLSAATGLFGMLYESIDDRNILYVAVKAFPFKGRYVKKQFQIQKGTTFTVVGFRRAHNPLCHWQDWDVVVQPEQKLEASDAEVHIDLDIAVDSSLITRSAD